MKTNIKMLICTFVAIAMAILSGVFIFVPQGVAAANSAMLYFEGVNSVGAIIRDEDCPIVVDREDLTFDIYKDDLRRDFRENSPSGRVSAKYTFRNPTDITAKVGLVFPFGYGPEYEFESEKDQKKYHSVKVNDEEIDKRIRYTYKPRKEENEILQFDLGKDTQFLSDDYIENDVARKDTKLYKYVCDTNYKDTSQWGINLVYTGEYSGIILCDFTSTTSKEKNPDYYAGYKRCATVQCDKDGYATFYSFEELNTSDFVCLPRYDATVSRFELKYAGETTFFDLAESLYDDESGIEKVDWYNALMARLCLYQSDGFADLSFDTDCRFRWYDYTLQFAPNQTIVNEVVAPLYPTINAEVSPNVYKYTYLLSPAKTWASFGEFHLRINTDLQTQNVSVGEMERQNDYYEYTCQGLPDGELTFDIYAISASVPNDSESQSRAVIAGIAIGLAVMIVLSTLIVFIVIASKKHKEKKLLQSFKSQNPHVATESEPQSDASAPIKTDAEEAEKDTPADNNQ